MDGYEPTLSEVLHDPNFCVLLRRFQRAAMTWDDFLEYPLPSHMSPLSTWETLSTIGECVGIPLFPSKDSDPLWYRRTYELDDLVESITRRSATDSPLHEMLLAHADQSLTTGLRLREATAAASLGGLTFDGDHLEMHVRLGTLPKHPTERIIANAIKLDRDLALFADEHITENLLSVFQHALYEGVDADTPIDGTHCVADEPIAEHDWAVLNRRITDILSYANDVNHSEDAPVLRGNLIADAIRFHQPFGSISTLIASLLSRLFYLKQGLPVLALIPISHLKYCWVEHEPEYDTFCTPTQYESTRRRSPCDLTVHQTLSARYIARALDDTDILLNDIREKDRSVRKMLSVDSRFNHRQRSILARAARIPGAEFHIRYHQDKHKISYATARRDLVELEDTGYLRCEQRGRAFVYSTAIPIEEIVRTL